MQYTILQCCPKDAEKKLNILATEGWRAVSQSESTWAIKKCFGLSKPIDTILNIILVKNLQNYPDYYTASTYVQSKIMEYSSIADNLDVKTKQ